MCVNGAEARQLWNLNSIILQNSEKIILQISKIATLIAKFGVQKLDKIPDRADGSSLLAGQTAVCDAG